MSTVSDIITGIRYDMKDDGTVSKFSDEKIMHFMNRFRIFLAAVLFREQCSLSLKKVDVVTTSGTATYDLMSAAADYYADFGIHYSDSSTPLNSKDLPEYIAGGYNTSTITGTANNYMILGQTLYLFGDIPDSTKTAWLWYYMMNTAFANATDTMPYGGIFDEPWRQFVTTLLLNRDEYSVDFEASLLKALETDVLRSVISYSPQPKMIPYITNPRKRGGFTIGRGYYS